MSVRADIISKIRDQGSKRSDFDVKQKSGRLAGSGLFDFAVIDGFDRLKNDCFCDIIIALNPRNKRTE